MSSASSGNADSSNPNPEGMEADTDMIDADQARELIDANVSMDINIGEGAEAATSSSKASVSWLFDDPPKSEVSRPDYSPEYEYAPEYYGFDEMNYAYDTYDEEFDYEYEYDISNDGDEFGFEIFSREDRKYNESLRSVSNSVFPILSDVKRRKRDRFERMMAKLAVDQKCGLSCDVVLEVDGRDFPVHKSVLIASSSYFSAMFTSQFNEREEKRIKIGNVTKEDFQTIIDFAYGTPIKLKLEDFERVYRAAEMLCVDEFILECRIQLQNTWNSRAYSFEVRDELRLEETAKILELGEMMSMKSLNNEVIRGLLRRLKRIPNHEFILNTSPTVLLHLLKRSSRYDLKKETDKMAFLLEWFRKNPEDRLLYLKEILGLLKIELVDRETFESFKKEVELLVSIHSTPEDVDEIKKEFRKIDQDLASNKVNIDLDVFLFFQEPSTLRGDVRIYQRDSSGKFSWFCRAYELEMEVHQCVFVEQSNHLVLLGQESLYVINVKNPERSLRQKEASILNRFPYGFVACAQNTQIIIAGRSPYENGRSKLIVDAFQYYESEPILIPLFTVQDYFKYRHPFAISVVGETLYVTEPPRTDSLSWSELLVVHKRELCQIYRYPGLDDLNTKSIPRYVNNRMILHYVENEKVFLIDQQDSLFSGISIKLDDEDRGPRPVFKTRIFEEVKNKNEEWIGMVKGSLVGSCRVEKTHALLVVQNNNLTLFSMESLEKFKFIKQLPKFPESHQPTKDWSLEDFVVFTRPSA